MKSGAVFFGTLRTYTVKVEIRVRSNLLQLLPELLRSGRKGTNSSNFVTYFQMNLTQNLNIYANSLPVKMYVTDITTQL